MAEVAGVWRSGEGQIVRGKEERAALEIVKQTTETSR